ncbi:AC096201.1 [Phodopus roborovskii]|uniref:AC096201.1 protein n=1 Tax=Phodopus roborovskii TaxID=109678 RepID=A0AAU9YPU5_PHORO|nr:AC096201.1 [Phodopus roborovskii]
MPLNQRMDTENVVHLYNGILFSRKKNEVLKFKGKWMELEETILSELPWEGHRQTSMELLLGRCDMMRNFSQENNTMSPQISSWLQYMGYQRKKKQKQQQQKKKKKTKKETCWKNLQYFWWQMSKK